MACSYSGFQSFLLLLGRICFSLIFVIAGASKIIAFDQTVQMMASSGVPAAQIMLVVAIIFELGGGILVFLGLFTRFGGLLLFLFMIPVTFYFHPFWGMEGNQMVAQMQHFLKNLAMLGGALYIMVAGGGKVALDALMHKSE